MLFLASCHLIFKEVMHVFVLFPIFVLRSIYGVTRVMFLTVFRATCTVSSAIFRQKITRELRGSTRRNITTIEVALTGRIWKKFLFLMLSQLIWLSLRKTETIRQILCKKTKAARGYRWTTQSSIVAVRARKSKKIRKSYQPWLVIS